MPGSIACSARIFRLASTSRTARSGPYRSMKTSTAAGRAGQFSAIPGPNAAFAAASSSAILASRNFARSIEPPLVPLADLIMRLDAAPLARLRRNRERRAPGPPAHVTEEVFLGGQPLAGAVGP